MSTIAAEIVLEYQRISETLEELGPDAPAGVDHWTAADLAAHLFAQFALGGVTVFTARALIAGGVHLTAIAGSSTDWLISLYRRRGFNRAVASLYSGPPKLLLRDRIAAVSLFEVWMHHDDLRRANELEPPAEPESIGRVLAFALRYQRKALGLTPVDRTRPNGDLLRWLSGRPSSFPPHEPRSPLLNAPHTGPAACAAVRGDINVDGWTVTRVACQQTPTRNSVALVIPLVARMDT